MPDGIKGQVRKALSEKPCLFSAGVGEISEGVGVAVSCNVEIPGCHELIGSFLTVLLPFSFLSGEY